MLRSGLYFIPIIVVFSQAFGLFGVEIAQTAADILAFFTALPFTVSFLRKLAAPLPDDPKETLAATKKN